MKIQQKPEENIQKAIISYRKAKGLFEEESTSEGGENHNKPD
jgi:hypothetical protein